MSLENTTGNEFRFGLAGRYLAFDEVRLRIGAADRRAVGSDPSAAIALYRPAWGSPLFVEPYAGVKTTAFNVVQDEHVIATYRQTRAGFGGDIGVNIGPADDVRLGARLSRSRPAVRVGDPGLPELSGKETDLVLRWTHDGQDSAILPTRGVHSRERDQPYLRRAGAAARIRHHPVEHRRDASGNRPCRGSDRSAPVNAGACSCPAGSGPRSTASRLPTEQFVLGGPLRLGAYDVGERRGDRYAARRLAAIFTGRAPARSPRRRRDCSADGWRSATRSTTGPTRPLTTQASVGGDRRYAHRTGVRRRQRRRRRRLAVLLRHRADTSDEKKMEELKVW